MFWLLQFTTCPASGVIDDSSYIPDVAVEEVGRYF